MIIIDAWGRGPHSPLNAGPPSHTLLVHTFSRMVRLWQGQPRRRRRCVSRYFIRCECLDWTTRLSVMYLYICIPDGQGGFVFVYTPCMCVRLCIVTNTQRANSAHTCIIHMYTCVCIKRSDEAFAPSQPHVCFERSEEASPTSSCTWLTHFIMSHVCPQA